MSSGRCFGKADRPNRECRGAGVDMIDTIGLRALALDPRVRERPSLDWKRHDLDFLV